MWSSRSSSFLLAAEISKRIRGARFADGSKRLAGGSNRSAGGSTESMGCDLFIAKTIIAKTFTDG
jgi:hypothetical protein